MKVARTLLKMAVVRWAQICVFIVVLSLLFATVGMLGVMIVTPLLWAQSVNSVSGYICLGFWYMFICGLLVLIRADATEG